MQGEHVVKKVTINGAELSYLEEGNGIPVVLVHGSLGDYRSWAFQMEPFSRYFRVFAISRRYHYPNHWAGKGLDYSVALHANDLADFIRELKIKPAHVIGSSYGAYVSLYLASKNPQLVRSLTLGEPPMLPWLDEIEGGGALKKTFSEKSFEPAKLAFSQGRMEEGVRFFIDGVMGEGTFSRLSSTTKALMMDNADEMKAETVAADYFSPLTFEDVFKVKCPVLLVNGEKSPKLFHLIVDALHRAMPQSERIIVPEASHSMQIANPQVYNHKVLEFLLEQ